MNPRVAVAITAQNQTSAAFGDVVKDANGAATQIEGASSRAGAAARRQSSAVSVLGKSSAMAANQQRNLAFQLNDVAVSLAGGANPLMVFAQQGSQIASIYGAEEGGLGRALKETGNMAVGMVTKFWPIAAAVAAGTAAIGGMAAAINEAGEQQVGFGDVALATWQLFSDGVYNIVQPAIAAIGGWFGDIWDVAWPVIKGVGNAIIGTFVGAFDAVTGVWNNLPAVFADIFTMAMNGAIDIVQGGVNGLIGPINDLMKSVGMDPLQLADLSGFKGQVTGAAGEAGKIISGAMGNAYSTDFLGDGFAAIKSRAQQLAAAAAEVGKAAGGAAKDMEPLNLGLAAANDNAEKLGDTLANSLTQGVMSVWQAFRSGGNVLEAISGQLANFADQLLGNAVQSFFTGIFGGAGGWSQPGRAAGSANLLNVGSFDGGGYTGAGSRSGGLDGKGGFMAMLHPDETVIDHTATTAANGNTGGHISVSVSIGVQNGNIVPLIVQVSGEVAGRKVKQEAPAAVAAARRNGTF